MFLADNKTFSLDMISGLETYAITKATEFKRYKVENSINPRYEIVEYDLLLIEEVYREIKFIIATFKPEHKPARKRNRLHADRTQKGRPYPDTHDSGKTLSADCRTMEDFIRRIQRIVKFEYLRGTPYLCNGELQQLPSAPCLR